MPIRKRPEKDLVNPPGQVKWSQEPTAHRCSKTATEGFPEPLQTPPEQEDLQTKQRRTSSVSTPTHVPTLQKSIDEWKKWENSRRECCHKARLIGFPCPVGWSCPLDKKKEEN
jgi:hypothetical protein